MMPDSLMVDPCGVVPAGDTVRSLSIGYVKNTGCVFDYKLLLEKQRKWKAAQGKIYDTTK